MHEEGLKGEAYDLEWCAIVGVGGFRLCGFETRVHLWLEAAGNDARGGRKASNSREGGSRRRRLEYSHCIEDRSWGWCATC